MIVLLQFLSGEEWQDPSYLNAVLEEAMHQASLGSHDGGHQLEKW